MSNAWKIVDRLLRNVDQKKKIPSNNELADEYIIISCDNRKKKIIFNVRNVWWNNFTQFSHFQTYLHTGVTTEQLLLKYFNTDRFDCSARLSVRRFDRIFVLITVTYFCFSLPIGKKQNPFWPVTNVPAIIEPLNKIIRRFDRHNNATRGDKKTPIIGVRKTRKTLSDCVLLPFTVAQMI